MNTTFSDAFNCRYTIHGREEQIVLPAAKNRLKGLFLLTEDDLGVSKLLADQLIYNGAFAYILEKESCLSEDLIRSAVESAVLLFGPVTGIIHLSGLSPMAMPDTMTLWHDAVMLQCKSLFHLLKFCGKDLKTPTYTGFKKLISCSLLGGYYGRDLCRQPGLPIAGSSQGLLRSLEYEWDHVMAKTIDFDLSLSAQSMTKIILGELCLGGGMLEVGYPQGNRTVFCTSKTPLQAKTKPSGLIPQKSQVILATGGGRGITAECIKLLSHAKCQYIIVGRSELLQRSEYSKYLGMSVSELRAAFLHEAKTLGTIVTPRMIEQKISGVLNDRDIRETIKILRRTGSSVQYVSCNVADQKAFGDVIDSVYHEFGKIDIVVHGAGVIDDHLLEDKSRTSFDKVFDTKVDSTFILYRKLRPASLKAFIIFSSTAGRYGNKGQADYAAANELLNLFAWRMRKEWPSVLVKSLNWGPWSGLGMATGVVNEQFIKKGIIPITPKDGLRLFMGELLHGNQNEVEVVMGVGTWDPERENKIREIFDVGNFYVNFN